MSILALLFDQLVHFLTFQIEPIHCGVLQKLSKPLDAVAGLNCDLQLEAHGSPSELRLIEDEGRMPHCRGFVGGGGSFWTGSDLC